MDIRNNKNFALKGFELGEENIGNSSKQTSENFGESLKHEFEKPTRVAPKEQVAKSNVSEKPVRVNAKVPSNFSVDEPEADLTNSEHSGSADSFGVKSLEIAPAKEKQDKRIVEATLEQNLMLADILFPLINPCLKEVNEIQPDFIGNSQNLATMSAIDVFNPQKTRLSQLENLQMPNLPLMAQPPVEVRNIAIKQQLTPDLQSPLQDQLNSALVLGNPALLRDFSELGNLSGQDNVELNYSKVLPWNNTNDLMGNIELGSSKISFDKLKNNLDLSGFDQVDFQFLPQAAHVFKPIQKNENMILEQINILPADLVASDFILNKPVFAEDIQEYYLPESEISADVKNTGSLNQSKPIEIISEPLFAQAGAKFIEKSPAKILERLPENQSSKLLEKLPENSSPKLLEKLPEIAAAISLNKSDVPGEKKISNDLSRVMLDNKLEFSKSESFRPQKNTKDFISKENEERDAHFLRIENPTVAASLDTKSDGSMGGFNNGIGDSNSDTRAKITGSGVLSRTQQIAENLQAQGGGSAKINIKDSAMGQLELQIRVGVNNNVHVEIKAQNEKIKGALQDGLDSLKTSLENHKLHLVEFRVVHDVSKTQHEGDFRFSQEGKTLDSQSSFNQQNHSKQNFTGDGEKTAFEMLDGRNLEAGRRQDRSTFAKGEVLKNFAAKTNIQRGANGSLKVIV